MFVNNPLPSQVVVLCAPPDPSLGVVPAMQRVNGVPFLGHLLGSFKRSGLGDIVLVCGAEGDRIERRYGDGAHSGLRLRYLHDPNDELGSAGALRAVENLLRPSFFVVLGHRYPLIDYGALAATFVEQGLPFLMSVRETPSRDDPGTCLVEADERGRSIVARYSAEGREAWQHVEYGVSVLRDDIVDMVPPGYSPLGAAHQRNALRKRIAAVEVPRRMYDVSSPTGLRALRDAFLSGAAPSYIHLLDRR